MSAYKVLTLMEAERMMAENNGNLYLRFSDITALPEGLKVIGSLLMSYSHIQKLPDGLTVGGDLDLSNTPIAALPDGLSVGGSLALSDTQVVELPNDLTVGGGLYLDSTPITGLPDGLTVFGSLDLSDTRITKLPDDLKVGGFLDLSNTQITELSNNLSVGRNLYLSCTGITQLPAGLTVGGCLFLTGTQITELPAGLTVGVNLNLTDTRIKALPKDMAIGGILNKGNAGVTSEEVRKVHRLRNGDCGDGSYIYADRILTFVKEVRHINGYTLYVGKIPGKNVVTDGEFYAHCENFREGIADIAFKRAKNRAVEQYRAIDRNTPIPLEDAKTMYRVITGACQQGTESFVQSLKTDGKLKGTYTVNEMLEVTEGQYGAETFAKFFA